MKQSVYWCDICYKKGANIDGTLKRKYYSCYLSRDWLGHLNSKKHKKLCKEVEEDEDNIVCKWCNIKFSKEGYVLHSERNKPLWDMKKIGSCKGMICNDFINEDDEKRYSSFNDYKASKLPKPKAKRTGVGKCSPTTGITRPPNKPKGWKDNIKLQLEEHYSICKSCDGMLNDTTLKHSDIDLMELTSLTMCKGCDDEINIEKLKDSMTEWLPDGKEADGELKFRRNPNFDKSKKICIIKSDIDEPNESEWELIDEFGNKLFFEGHCDTCTLPINDENYSSRLLTYLDIDVCDCD